MKQKPNIILDSGAFTAWTKKVNIDIDEYAKFVLEYIDHLDYVVGLDVIPAEFGRKPTVTEIEESASMGWNNYQYLLGKGIPKEKLIHVFHQGENFKWLERMVEEIPYIGLSPANDRTTGEKKKWLDQCMKYVTNENGMPKVKFHGFAVTAFELVKRYPWYSVDSATWIISAGIGVIFVPRMKDGIYSYEIPPYTILVSNRHRLKGKRNHISFFSKDRRKYFLQYFEYKGFTLGQSVLKSVPVGYKLKKDKKPEETWWDKDHTCVEEVIEVGLSNGVLLRRQINIIYFMDFEKSLPQWPWCFDRRLIDKGFLI